MTKSKKKTIIAIVAILILLLCPLVIRDDVRRNFLPDLTFDEDDGKNETQEADSAIIDYVGGFTAIDGSYPENLSFHNSAKNKCNFIVSLYLSDGTLVYKTDEIEPGGEEVAGRLFTKLDKGTYENVLLCYDCYDDTLNPVGRCEFTIKIRSV